MNIIKVIGKVIKKPTDFFKRVGKGEKHLGFAFGYYALLSLLYMVIGGLVVSLFWLFLPSEFKLVVGLMYSFLYPFLIIFFILSYILGLGLTFVWSGLLHIWIKIFGGKNNYVKTYELGVFAATPTFLLGWIPIVGIAGGIWSLILLIIGTQQVHNISKRRAILMYVIPLVLFLIIYLVLVFSMF